MHENNFEKQVREKMDQLGFDPGGFRMGTGG